uniref:Tyr recombinase domain-containing protein n=1 Tax=Rheinheimera sp. BAL341 TaxID=1708203 RepID=A0A486XTF7_9GAMM
MNISELHQEIRQRLFRLRGEPVISNEVVILTKQEYSNLFWQLLHTQQSSRFRDAGINLIEQLNNYIAAHRAVYPASFSIQAPVRLKRPTPPVKQSSLKDIYFIETLDRVFNDSLSEQHDCNRFDLGRLLYSAMRYGGLLRKDYLNSLTSVLLNGKPQCYQKLIWFELKGAAGEIQIWQPDKMSVQLLNQWYSKREPERKPPKLEAQYYVDAFLHRADTKQPNSLRLTWLIQAISSRLSLEVSPFSLDVLTGTQPNLTLKPQVFYRLISQKAPPQPLVETTTVETENDSTKGIVPVGYKSHSRQYDLRLALAFIKEIKSLLRRHKRDSNTTEQSRQLAHSNTARDIEVRIKATSVLPPVLHHLMHWVCVRLTSQSRWSGKLSPSTLISYLDTIANPLIMTFGERDLVNIDPEELTELYTQLIDEGPSLLSQTKRARILRDFHVYLALTYQVSPCYMFQQHIAKSLRLEALTVDANILMPWEYRHACDYLLESTELQSGLNFLQARAILVLLMLGFRCGLRRREALFLRLQDVEIPVTEDSVVLSEYTTIYITPHEQRSLKTTSAERRIPIGLLLNNAEKSIFAEYLQARQAFGREHSPYLFYFGDTPPLGAIGRPVASENLLFEPLTTLLQRITGDNSFRFHHLRHSFATWMLWTWQRKATDVDPLPIPTLTDVGELSHLVKARAILLQITDTQPTRKILHAISAMIGHAGPSMTLFHYIHSASWLNWVELNNSAPLISRDAEASLAGVDVRTATRARLVPASPDSQYQGMADYAAQKLLKHSAKVPLKHWLNTTSRQPGALNSVVTHRDLGLDIYCALLRHINFGIPIEMCAQDVNIELDLLVRARENARYFFSQQFNAYSKFEYKKRPRNHKRFIYEDSLRVNIAPVAALPALPANPKSLNIALRMLKEFHQLPEHEQMEVLWAAHYAVTFNSVTWPHFRCYKKSTLHRFIHTMLLFKKAFAASQRMRFTLVSSAPLNSEQRTSLWRGWSLDNWPDQIRDNRADKDYSIKGHVAIDFIANSGSKKSRQRKMLARGKSQVRYRRRLSEYGVRFGLYLLFMVSNSE